MKNDLGLIIKSGNIVVSSKDVSDNYGKEHKHVMRDIRNIIELVPEAKSNFGPTYYSDSQGRKQPCYEMDRQGFSMLVMGFTGKKAKEFTYKYTSAFEEMARQLSVYKPKMTSAGEVASLIRVLRASMKDQKSPPSDITEMEKMICDQFNVKLPETFVRKPKYVQISMFLPAEQ